MSLISVTPQFYSLLITNPMTEKLSAFDAAMDKWQEAVDQRETAIDTLSTLIKYLKTNCDIDHENDPKSFDKMMEQGEIVAGFCQVVVEKHNEVIHNFVMMNAIEAKNEKLEKSLKDKKKS